MRKLLLSLIAAVVATAVYAVPAIPTPLTFKQTDGSSITVRLVGDERFSTYLTTDGLALERAVDGDFYYKTATAVSKVRAHNVNARTQTELNYIKANSQQMQLQSLVPANLGGNNTARKAPALMATTDVPQTGSPRIPVILVQYSDFKLRSSNPVSTFESQFNTKTKSCLQYFSDQSRGQFTPKFDILGPVTLSQTRAYYGARTSSDNDAKPGSMVGEAVKQLTSVDWSLYDNDKNGSVDVVIILYAGPGEAQGASSDAIWPHQWYLSSAYYYGRSDYNAFSQNGVRIDKYACFCETSGSSDSRTTVDGIGTFCHEFSHCLGLPDFYETTYANGNFGMGNWSIMCSGSYLNNSATPAGYTAYEKEFMGWMSIPTAEANTYYTLKSMDKVDGEAVRIYNPQSSNEYYILENHQRTGWYAYQANSGLMVNHVTYSSTAWSNNTVNNSDPQRMTIIPADNDLGSRYSSSESGDLYPYNGNNKLTDSSAPAAVLNTGSKKLMGKPITEITKNSNGTVSFWFMKDFEKVVPTIQSVVPGDITISSFAVKWNSNANMRSFTFSVTGPDGYDKTFDIEENTITIEDLKPGTTYTCKVKAIYIDDSEGEWSKPVNVTTKGNPVLNAAVAETVTSNSFTASWQAMDDVQSYTLNVRRKGLTNYTLLMHETFDKCTTANTTNIASSLSKFTDNTGWSGKYVYQNVSGVSLASSSRAGNITSPSLDFSGYNGKVVVKIVAGTYNTVTDCSLTISADGATQSVVLPNNAQKEYTVVLNTNGSTSGDVTFTALPGKKVVIYDIKIYAGDADDLMESGAPRKAATVTGNVDEMYITGITDTSYNVQNLLDGASYQYRVKAVFNNNSESGWSNVEEVELKSTPTIPGDVNGDGSVDIADVNSLVSIILEQKSVADFPGKVDINGDGKVDIADINAIIAIILSK